MSVAMHTKSSQDTLDINIHHCFLIIVQVFIMYKKPSKPKMVRHCAAHNFRVNFISAMK